MTLLANPKRLVLLLPLLLVFSQSRSDAQIPSNVFRRVLMIKVGNATGTAFTIEDAGRQYLVTAKHLAATLQDKGEIQVRSGDDWVSVNVQVERSVDPVDIVVLVPARQLTVTFPLEPTMKGIRYGQDVFFLGFPYGLATNGKNVNGLFPVAFMKEGAFSASDKQGDGVVIYLDGHNNPGFSGGPIVFRNLDDNTFKVMGVVSGYRHEFTPVYETEPIKEADITPEDIALRRILIENGKPFRLKETTQRVRQNTGIVVGYSIQHALDLIKKNPSGAVIQSN